MTTDTTKIQRLITKYYEQLYVNKLDNLQEKTYNLPRLSQEEMVNALSTKGCLSLARTKTPEDVSIEQSRPAQSGAE